jgi:hypothetical protein
MFVVNLIILIPRSTFSLAGTNNASTCVNKESCFGVAVTSSVYFSSVFVNNSYDMRQEEKQFQRNKFLNIKYYPDRQNVHNNALIKESE